MRKNTPDSYAFFGIRITSYHATIDASVNYEVRDIKRADIDTQVYRGDTSLEIEGVCTYPDNQAGHHYTMLIYGHERSGEPFSLKLKDCHVVNEKWERVYRKVKGKEEPVYDIPKGIGSLEKRRGSDAWSGVVWIMPNVVSDMLALLPNVSPLYLDLHVKKEGKIHYIVGLSLKTQDPAEC